MLALLLPMTTTKKRRRSLDNDLVLLLRFGRFCSRYWCSNARGATEKAALASRPTIQLSWRQPANAYEEKRKKKLSFWPYSFPFLSSERSSSTNELSAMLLRLLPWSYASHHRCLCRHHLLRCHCSHRRHFAPSISNDDGSAVIVVIVIVVIVAPWLASLLLTGLVLVASSCAATSGPLTVATPTSAMVAASGNNQSVPPQAAYSGLTICSCCCHSLYSSNESPIFCPRTCTPLRVSFPTAANSCRRIFFSSSPRSWQVLKQAWWSLKNESLLPTKAEHIQKHPQKSTPTADITRNYQPVLSVLTPLPFATPFALVGPMRTLAGRTDPSALLLPLLLESRPRQRPPHDA